MASELAFRIGSGLLAAVALGFGIPAVIGAVHFSRSGSIWRLFGFPTYDSSRFESWGVRVGLIPLMLVFAAVCLLAVIAAALLWVPALAVPAAVAGLVLIAAQFVFWRGFDLPYGPPVGVLSAIALVVGLVTSRG